MSPKKSVPEAQELTIPGLKPEIAAKAYGPEDGRPLLALHGWLDNAATFDSLAPTLTAAGNVRLVAIDFPGHGLSAHRSPDATYHFVDWVSDVFRVADALGWERFSILGHSMGAAVAMLAAGTLPKRIEALALIEGLAPITALAVEAPERLAAHLAAAGRQKPPARYRSEAEALLARAAAGEFADPKAIAPVVRRGLKQDGDAFVWRSDSRLKLPSPLRLTHEQALAFLRRIVCPALLVYGDQGLRPPAASFAELLAAVANLKKLELPGFHHLHLDNPEPVAEAIAAFLDI